MHRTPQRNNYTIGHSSSIGTNKSISAKGEDHEMSLGEPLLDREKKKEEDESESEAENMEKQRKRQPSISPSLSQKKMDITKTDYLAGRIYANNAPRIFLEIITARTAALIIALTYICFIVCFSVDLYTTYKSFTSSNYDIPAYTCGTPPPPIITRGPRAGSNFDGCSAGMSWNSTVTDLQNVISIELTVQQTNVTRLLVNANETFSIAYNVTLWTCYDKEGCGQSFDSNDRYTTDANVWQKVLVHSATTNIDQANDITSGNDGTLQVELIPNTFQNQESIPTNGLVRAYYVLVNYQSAPYNLFTGEDATTQPYITYKFDVVARPKQPIADSFTIVLMVLTIGVLIWYLRIFYMRKHWLTEQKWIAIYFILVILFQNPVYCIITWFKDPPPAGAAFSSYLLSYLGQSGLFTLWLCFGDPVHRKTQSKLLFYGPKIFIGLLILTASLVVLAFQFPGLDPSDPSRSAVEASQNWSRQLKLSLIIFTMLYLCLIWLWTILWTVQLFRTGRKMKKLPYMNTRYIQLSYRFFAVQATLVTLYYILQYAAVVYFISVGASNGANFYDITSLTDNINTLFRQQSQLFGKALFLTVYAMVLAFFYLPADLMDQKGVTSSLAATYTITEIEHRNIVRQRKKVIRKLGKNLINQVTGVNHLVNAKADVFCVDLALNMRDLSFQAYYDFPDLHTVSGYGGELDLPSIGYELVDKFYSSEYELFCFIARETASKRLAVCFRGTASKKQMEANLKYSQIPVNFEDLPMTSLDQLDGLNIRCPNDIKHLLEEMDMKSVSEDEEELYQEGLGGGQDGMEFNNTMIRRDSETGESIGVMRTLSHRPTLHKMGSSTSTTNNPQQPADNSIFERADHVREGIQKVFTNAVGATNQGLHAVVDATADLMVSAASSTPMLKNVVLPFVHSGFWEAYQIVRGFIHSNLRTQLVLNPTTVFFTGHSLGGALATFAALDVSLHTVPRVNAYLKHHAKLLYLQEKTNRMLLQSMQSCPNPLLSHSKDKTTLSKSSSLTPGTLERRLSDIEEGLNSRCSLLQDERDDAAVPVFVKKVNIVMINFGSPRVGNRSFVQLYNRIVPSSFRVVVDGDLVAGLPPSKYAHVGTEILIDSLGAGSIIIDPSFVERWLRTHMKSSVAVHSLLVYRKGLLGLKLSAECLKQQYDKEREIDPEMDPLRVAIKMRTQHKVEQIVKTVPGFAHGLPVQEEAGNDIISEREHALLMQGSLEVGPISIVAEHHDIAMKEIVVDASPIHESSTLTIDTTDERRRRVYSTEGSEGDKEESKEDHLYAKHYAHDVENMDALMQQIRTLKNRGGPVHWVKKHTVDRMKPKRVKSQRSFSPKANSGSGSGAASSEDPTNNV